MNYLDWHVGMKVVCINDNYELTLTKISWFGLKRVAGPVIHNLNKGDTYTITGICRFSDLTTAALTCTVDLVAVFLAEAQHFGTPVPWPFPAPLFRRLQSKTADISIFTQMLKPVSREVEKA